MVHMEEIREKISQCDVKLIEALTERMQCMKAAAEYKKKNEVPVFGTGEEAGQADFVREKLKGNPFEHELEDIFTQILKSSKRVQAKNLFSYNIMLIGFMGSGKSTVSDYLCRTLAMEQVEMDALIAQKEGMSIPDIFEKHGEEYFRNCESNLLIELQNKEHTVVSCGGGVVLRDENVAHMKKRGRIVLLTASPESIYERVKDSKERPLLNDNMNVEFIAGMMEKRKEKYEKASDISINTDNKTIQEICEELVGKLAVMES